MSEPTRYKGLPGQIADTSSKDVVSLRAAGKVPFGVFVTEKDGEVLPGGDGEVRGVAVRQQNSPVGYYREKSCVGVLQMGPIWVKARSGSELKRGEPVTFDPTTGELTKGGIPVANARLVTGVEYSSDNALVAKVDFHAALTAAKAPTPPTPNKDEL